MNKRQTIELINRTVCITCGIEWDEYKSNQTSRKWEYVQIRQITHHICWRLNVSTLQYIGCVVDGKDHASVHHSRKQVNTYLECDKDFRELYDKCYAAVLDVVTTEKKQTYTFTIEELTDFVNKLYAYKCIAIEVVKLDIETALDI